MDDNTLATEDSSTTLCLIDGKLYKMSDSPRGYKLIEIQPISRPIDGLFNQESVDVIQEICEDTRLL